MKLASRKKKVQFIKVKGSLSCLYDLRKMLPHTGVEADDVLRDDEQKFVSCSKFNIGSKPSKAALVGEIVYKLITVVGDEKKGIAEEYEWFVEDDFKFFNEYKEVK